MSFEGYFTEHDDILENKLGITDPEEMSALEAEIVPLRMAELLSSPPKGKMDMAYLRKIHRRLFSDLYTMAGKIRTVDMAKGGSAFCYVQFIENEQQRIFSSMPTLFPRGKMMKEDFVRSLAKLSADLNALHPFREGNGRTIRTFLCILAMRHGYHLDFSLADTDQLMIADIAAFRGDLDLLTEVYAQIISCD